MGEIFARTNHSDGQEIKRLRCLAVDFSWALILLKLKLSGLKGLHIDGWDC